MKLAVYGTLRGGLSNHGYLMSSKVNFIGFGKTEEKYTMRANGIPYVGKQPLHHVVVEVFETEDENVISSVDSLEGHPRWYKREEISVILDNGAMVKAWLYFMESTAPIVETGNFLDYGQSHGASKRYWEQKNKVAKDSVTNDLF